MIAVQQGQCGLCMHFGEVHANQPALVQLRQSHAAPEGMLDECDHPRLAALHLKVTPNSGCDGYTPAKPA